MLERQDLEVEEKVDADLTDVGTETWTDRPGEGTSETRQNQTFACSQSKNSASVPEADAGDAVTMGDRSEWDQLSEECMESASECPTSESGVYQITNTTSVIISAQRNSKVAGDATAAAAAANAATTVCSVAEARKEEAEGDNQSIATATAESQAAPAEAEHPGKVIVTNVTINSLTVTFKEATVAEGFFKGY